MSLDTNNYFFTDPFLYLLIKFIIARNPNA